MRNREELEQAAQKAYERISKTGKSNVFTEQDISVRQVWADSLGCPDIELVDLQFANERGGTTHQPA